MNKYVLAYYDNYENDLKQYIVEGETPLEVANKFLEIEFETEEEMYDYVWNNEGTISLIKI